METETILVSEVIPAPPKRIFAAWLDSDEHSALTGESAEVEPFVGGKHTAFGGYISGETTDLEPDRRIVQTWRSTEFPAESSDSRLEITLEETVGGTLVTLLHTDLPTGQGEQYRESWIKFYLEPMKAYFGKGRDDAGHTKASGGAAEKATTAAPKARRRVKASARSEAPRASRGKPKKVTPAAPARARKAAKTKKPAKASKTRRTAKAKRPLPVTRVGRTKPKTAAKPRPPGKTRSKIKAKTRTKAKAVVKAKSRQAKVTSRTKPVARKAKAKPKPSRR